MFERVAARPTGASHGDALVRFVADFGADPRFPTALHTRGAPPRGKSVPPFYRRIAGQHGTPDKLPQLGSPPFTREMDAWIGWIGPADAEAAHGGSLASRIAALPRPSRLALVKMTGDAKLRASRARALER